MMLQHAVRDIANMVLFIKVNAGKSDIIDPLEALTQETKVYLSGLNDKERLKFEEILRDKAVGTYIFEMKRAYTNGVWRQ